MKTNHKFKSILPPAANRREVAPIYLKTPDAGHSCESCCNFHRTRSVCLIKNNKQVNRYNICDYHGQTVRIGDM